ncbi:AAA family ATPase [Segatella buccae]|uniref:AAA family ATPase n=1 Tax=Segatella buccae TaxID=28126 RepID=UPI0027B97CAF|nr:AAA family ATPase [Segatella buccae]
MKHLVIRHFGPIKEADMDLRRVNIIIGPQSSGKSTILKIACFCDWMERQIELTQNPDKYCDSNFFIENLIGFHKLEGYLQQETYIRYENDAVSFDYSEKNKKCTFKWNEAKRWKYKRTKIAYIPAERNLVAAIPNWYQVNMNKDNILDFMKEWEFARKAFLKGEQILDLPVKYEYNAYNQGDRIKLENGKELDLTVASSGLQALTPLYVMLRYLTSEYYKEAHTNVEQDMLRQNLHEVVAKECAGLTKGEQQNIIDTILTPHHTDLFVEEPEAHIFPSTQKSFVYSLVEMLNGNVQHTCFLATHSPYILTAFNNIILAGETMAMSKEKADKVSVIMPKRQTLCYDEVAAFEMSNGRDHSIMDEDFRLISADAIDAASQEISNDFDYLLNI